MLAALEREGGVREQELVARRNCEALGLDHRPSAARRLQELEPELGAPPRQQLDLLRRARALVLQPGDLRQLRLRLPGLLLRRGAEAGDEALEPLDVAPQSVRSPRRGAQPRGLLASPLVPGPGEERRPAGLELEHGRRDRFEEPAVVGDQDDPRVARPQLRLEPLEVGDVQVVRRLVQQQQVGIARERPRERGARQLAARERPDGPVEVGGREAEPAQDGRVALAPGVAAGVLQPGLRRAVALKDRRVVAAVRHRVLEHPQLVLDGKDVGGPGERVLAERRVAGGRGALVVERHARPLRERQLAPVDLRLAGEHAQQRRLPGAVRAGERDAIAPADGERDAREEDVARELLAQVVGRDDHPA